MSRKLWNGVPVPGPVCGKEMTGISAKTVLVFCALLALSCVVTSCSNSVYAHGGGFQLNKRATAGPYNLTIGTIPDPPTVGEAILILEVTDPDTNQRIQGLNVTIVPRGPESQDGTPENLYGIADSYDPTLYETRAELPSAGPWTFDVMVDGLPGSGEAQFSYDVKRVNPIGGIITLLTLLAFLAVIGLSMRAFLKERNKGRRVRRRKA